MQPHIDVLIAGGGPTGLTLAADLLRHGIAFRIIDKKPEPERFSKAANFWPRTQEAAAAIGFGERIAAEAVAVRTQAVHAYGKFIGLLHPRPRATPFPDTLAINQGHFERIVSEHLAGAGQAVERGSTIVALHNQRTQVEVQIARSDGSLETLCCRYLVGCDGGRSTVRALAGLPMPMIDLPGRGFWQIDCRVRWSRPGGHDRLHFFLFDEGFCGVVPLPGGYHRIFLCADEAAVPDRDPTLEQMQLAVAKIANDPGITLFDPVWFSHGRFRYGVAQSFRKGRVFLAGDAGHATIPIGGQGMNSGIQDAFNLGWKLAAVLDKKANPDLLDSYTWERRRVRQELAEDQAANFRRLMFPNALLKFAVRHLGPIALRSGLSVELGRRDESQLSIAYPDSPLNQDCLKGGRARPGERAPDAEVVVLPGLQPGRLFTDLYAGGWTLLCFDGGGGEQARAALQSVVERIRTTYAQIRLRPVLTEPALPPLAAGEVVFLDLDRFAHRAYGVEGPALYLIRPDGHIAFRGSPAHANELLAYSRRWLTHTVAQTEAS